MTSLVGLLDEREWIGCAGNERYDTRIGAPALDAARPTAPREVDSALLFGLSLADPVTLGVVVATLALVALRSSALPPWRAIRLDPAEDFSRRTVYTVAAPNKCAIVRPRR